jgi:hypothetical protein
MAGPIQSEADHVLADQGRQSMPDRLLPPAVHEAARDTRHQTYRPVGGTEQKRAGIQGGRPASNAATAARPAPPSEPERGCTTVYRHRTVDGLSV